MIKALYDFGISVDVIVKHMKISKTTIYKMIKDGFKYEDKEERELILDEDDRTAIIEAANDNYDLTAAEIARDEKLNAKESSLNTIERLLKDNGVKCRRKRVMQGPFREKNARKVRAGKTLYQVEHSAHGQDLLL
jgi:transposase